jgi:hypothetical protein
MHGFWKFFFGMTLYTVEIIVNYFEDQNDCTLYIKIHVIPHGEQSVTVRKII